MKPIYSSGKIPLKKESSIELKNSKSILKSPEPLKSPSKLDSMQQEMLRLNENLNHYRRRSEHYEQLLNQNQSLKNEIENQKFINKKISEQLRLLKRKNDSDEQLRHKNITQEIRVRQLTKQINDYKQEIEMLNSQIQKLHRDNGIDKATKRSVEYFSYDDKFRNRQSVVMKNSRAFSDRELLEGERFSIKLAEKNKEYEQLYHKYQSLQSDYTQIEERIAELEQQRKLLTEKLGKIQIHTEGDEADELQQKMALMSSEMMRLKNLSQTKTHEARELNMRVNQLTLKKQNLQREIIEKDKLVLNYKQQLRIAELQLAEQLEHMHLQEDQLLSNLKEDNARLKQDMQKLSKDYRQKMQFYKNVQIQNALLQQNTQRMAQQNNEFSNQYRRLKDNQQKYREIQTKIANLESQIRYLKQSNQSLKLQNQNLQHTVQEVTMQKGIISQQRQKTKQINFKLQSNLAVIEGELKRARVQLNNKEIELKQLHHNSQQKIIIKENQLKTQSDIIRNLQQDIQRQNTSQSQLLNYQQVVRQMQQLQNYSATLKLQLNEYEQKIVLLAQENERLTQKLKDYQHTINSLDRFKTELEQKTKQQRQLTRELNSITSKQKAIREELQSIRQQNRQLQASERQAENWQFKNRQLKDQLEGLRTVLSLKQTELLNFQRRFQTSPSKDTILISNQQTNSKNKIALSSQQIQIKHTLQSKIKQLTEQQIRDKNYISQLQKKQVKMDQNYSILSQQIARLNKLLEDKVQQNLQLKNEIDLLQHKVRTCETLLEQRKTVQDSYIKIINEDHSQVKKEIYQQKIRTYEKQLQSLGQRCQTLKQQTIKQEARITVLTNQKNQQKSKVQELQFQIADRAEHFRRVQQSFRMTVIEIKSSNERLERSIKQIETHYISKYENKQRECEQLQKQTLQLKTKFQELQKYTLSNQTHSYKQGQTQYYADNMNSSNDRIKQENETFRRMKTEYQQKLALLSQQLQRLNAVNQRKQEEIYKLRQQLNQGEEALSQNMRQSTASAHAIETLSLEIERLNTVLGQHAQTLRSNHINISRLQNQNADLHSRIDQQTANKQQIQQQFNNYRQAAEAEIGKLRTQLNQIIFERQQKIKQIEQSGSRQTHQNLLMTNQQIRNMKEQNNELQHKLNRLKQERQQLIVQCQELKRQSQENQGQEQKISMINNYQWTIQSIQQQNYNLKQQKEALQTQWQELNNISHQLQEKLRIAEKNLSQITRNAQTDQNHLNHKSIGIRSQRLKIQNNTEHTKLQTQYFTQANLVLNKYTDSLDHPQEFITKNTNDPQDIHHRFILLESANKKLTLEMECLRKTNVEYQFKMNKLKEEFTLLNRLVKDYRDQNDKLKQKNKAQRTNNFANTYNNFRSPQHHSVLQNSHRNNMSPPPIIHTENFEGVRSKLFEEIDRLNRVNISLQSQVHDLRLFSTDNLSLRKRLEQNAATMVLLFVQIEALRLRLREKQGLGMNSPRKSNN